MATPTSSSGGANDSFRVLRRMHSKQREHLVLTKQPLKTSKFFLLAVIRYLEYVWNYAAKHKFTFLLFLALSLCTVFTLTVGGYDQVLQESWLYFRFALWWVGLGVASSIGLGSGLHTFLLYLGPHIAMFTLKATFCGREDLKFAPYDTAHFRVRASWADKDCASFGPPLYPHIMSEHEGYMVPLLKVLGQVQLEAILWGIGTALGELPPYFVSRAARLSGERLNALDDIENVSPQNDSMYKRIQQWMVTKLHHFGFLTILIFASVPNPLFDLAGMLCGHSLVPFWKFFFATLLGKAVIKTHIQTIFVILLFNAHHVELITDTFGWGLSKMPAFSFVLPRITAALQNAQESIRHGEHSKSGQPNVLAQIWNTFLMFVLFGFIASVVNSTAQSFLLDRQLEEIEKLESQQGKANGHQQQHEQQT